MRIRCLQLHVLCTLLTSVNRCCKTQCATRALALRCLLPQLPVPPHGKLHLLLKVSYVFAARDCMSHIPYLQVLHYNSSATLDYTVTT